MFFVHFVVKKAQKVNRDQKSRKSIVEVAICTRKKFEARKASLNSYYIGKKRAWIIMYGMKNYAGAHTFKRAPVRAHTIICSLLSVPCSLNPRHFNEIQDSLNNVIGGFAFDLRLRP